MSPAILTTVCGYALQAALLGLAFAATRSVGDAAGALESVSMRLLIGGSAGALLASSASLLVLRARTAGSPASAFRLPLLVSLVTGVLCLAVLEIGVRIIARPDPLGARVASTILLPYEWPALVSANREMLKRNSLPDAFFIPDKMLGWAVGSARRSRDGLYVSSREGLRSRVQGESLVDAPRDGRIALFGNSFAFSEEVAYADSLAPKLEAALAPGSRVLNFGVPGYGVDQAVLRARYSIPDWSPRVALLTFIEDDLYRVGNIYAFLKVDWGLPVSKPRFVLRDGNLTLLNSPVLGGEDLFGRSTIFELPILDHEIEFQAQRWRQHPLHAFYLLRLLNGLFPTWPARGEAVTEEAIAAVSTSVITDFARATASAGVTPVIAYLPTSGDYSPGGRRVLKRRVLGDLAAANVPVADLTDCIAERVERQDLFVAGGHYTGRGNKAVAECLAPLVRSAPGLTKPAPSDPEPAAP